MNKDDKQLTKEQQDHWDILHKKQSLGEYADHPTTFAEALIKGTSLRGKLLELGCGAGNDSIYFAKEGFEVLATDFSPVAIEQNKSKYENIPNLTFQTLNIADPMPFEDNSFDVIYARLSLHYFSDNKTKEIFKELHRTLKLQGKLYFMCKSTNDVTYGKGEEIEKNVFLHKGHLRHLFTIEYTKECLDSMFRTELLEEKTDQVYQTISSFIECIVVNE